MGRFLQCLFCITVVMTSVLTARVSKYYADSLEIPEETRSDSKHQINKRETAVLPPPKIPESCKNRLICEQIENYPTALANELWAQEKNKKNFVKDVLYEPTKPAKPVYHLCNSTLKVIPIQAGRDKNNTWYYVMNLPKTPLQSFRIEICSGNTDHFHCNHVTFQPNYEGRCLQKYAYRLTYIINEQGRSELKSLKIPTCCSCAIRQI